MRKPKGGARTRRGVRRAVRRPQDPWETAWPGSTSRYRVGNWKKVVKSRAAGVRPFGEGFFFGLVGLGIMDAAGRAAYTMLEGIG